MGGETADVVRARRFELVDAEDHLRAVLAAEDGSTAFTLHDKKGEPSLVLTVEDGERPGVHLLALGGESYISIAIQPDGDAAVTLRDHAGTPRAIVSLGGDGTPRVMLADENAQLRLTMVDEMMEIIGPSGEARMTLMASPEGVRFYLMRNELEPAVSAVLAADGAAGLALRGRDGSRVGIQEVGDHQRLALTMHDELGELRALLAIHEKGQPTFTFADAQGIPRLAIQTGPDGTPRIVMSDQHRRDRITVALDAQGEPAIGLSAEDGKTGVRVGSLPDGQMGVAVTGSDSRARVVLTARPDCSEVRLSGERAHMMLRLSADNNGYPYLVIFGDDGSRRLMVGLQQNGLPGIELYDGTDAEARAILGIADDGGPIAIIRPSDGKQIVLKSP